VRHDRSGPGSLWSPLRRLSLVAVMAVGLIVGWGAAALSGSGPPWLLTVDGVMMPDNKPGPTSTPSAKNQPSTRGAVIVYSFKGTLPTYTFYRGGQAWMTFTESGGSWIVTDPNNGQQKVLTIQPGAATLQRKTLTTSPTH
jgi:hypothetical protein